MGDGLLVVRILGGSSCRCSCGLVGLRVVPASGGCTNASRRVRVPPVDDAERKPTAPCVYLEDEIQIACLGGGTPRD